MRITKYELVFLVVVMLVLGGYLIVQLTAPKIEKYLENSDKKIGGLHNILPLIRNGDIILLSGDTRGERTCKFFAKSPFSHVGVLFREPHPETEEDIVYILDCDIGQHVKDGVRVLPLKDKLERYKGQRIGAIKRLYVDDSQRRPSDKDFVQIVGRYLSKDFDPYILTWWVERAEWLYNLIKNSDKMFCSEFIAEVFVELGIMKNVKKSAGYTPGDFHRGNLPLNKGYSLSEDVFFRF